MRKNPHLLELHALQFLNRLCREYRKPLTLSEIPDQEWEAIARRGYDIVWLMGVWRRSPAAREKAMAEPYLRQAYDQLLPGWKPGDITGSPYAIYSYQLDPALGPEDDLIRLRRNLQRAGLKLFLDFIPNHMALDHPDIAVCPEAFIHGTQGDCQKFPGQFFSAHGRFYAHGKDPFFPAWTDTVQINLFAPAARAAAEQNLLRIAEAADGVRCDMAMLALNRIFKKNWQPFLSDPEPAAEYWPELIRKVRSHHPDFILMAEAYWDTEWELQQLGFDYTYDKRLYDRLLHDDAPSVREHLNAAPAYRDRSVRFIENHDERRAPAAFGLEKSLAAAAVILTIPGLRFIHDGQTEGRRQHVPVQLAHEPGEAADSKSHAFYKKLLEYAGSETLHTGRWQLLSVGPAWPGASANLSMLAWVWDSPAGRRLVVINYSAARAQARIRLPDHWLESRRVILADCASGKRYERHEDELRQTGLYVDLEAWQAHLFELQGQI